MSNDSFTPRPFSVEAYPDDDSALTVVAWGMTLPDGTAVAVGWHDGSSSTVALCTSPERAAHLHHGSLAWIDGQHSTGRAETGG